MSKLFCVSPGLRVLERQMQQPPGYRPRGYLLKDKRGENYVDTAVKILIAVVIGALLLAGLYALFGDVVMPTLTRRIQEMFNYAG